MDRPDLPHEPQRELPRPRLTVNGGSGLRGWRSTIQTSDSWVVEGELTIGEILRIRQLVNGNLWAGDDPLEVWVPTPSPLLRWVRHGAPDLPSLDGLRQLGKSRPLADPDLHDRRLRERPSLASLARRGTDFSVCRKEGSVSCPLPLEGWGFFTTAPVGLVSLEPGRFAALVIERPIEFRKAGDGDGG